MAKIGIIHNRIRWGGSSAVFANVLQALQEGHRLIVITEDNIDIRKVNQYYNTEVEDVRVINLRYLRYVRQKGSFRYLGSSVLSRLTDISRKDRDLVINTSSDIKVRGPSITYLHGPYQLNNRKVANRNHSGMRKVYFDVCNLIESKEEDQPKYLANSKWTSESTKEMLHEEPEVIYPPVYTSGVDQKNWSDKEERIITVGRVSPEKNTIRNIEIMEEVNKRGYSIDYQIVGPLNRSKDKYTNRVIEKAEEMEFVHIEGKVSRKKLSSMMSQVKYGLHGHDCEHFGIVVAELISHGVIPFIPNKGGQKEIVNDCQKVTYKSKKDAVEKIVNVIRKSDLAKEIKRCFPKVEKKFGVKRFRNEISTVVEKML